MYVFLPIVFCKKILLPVPETCTLVITTAFDLAWAKVTASLAAAHLCGAPAPSAAVVGTNCAKQEVRHLTRHLTSPFLCFLSSPTCFPAIHPPTGICRAGAMDLVFVLYGSDTASLSLSFPIC